MGSGSSWNGAERFSRSYRPWSAGSTFRTSWRPTEIEYSAYDAMAEAELERIVTEAQQQWPGVRVALRHRVGRVPVGEASIAIVAAAPHRAEAFAACRHVIEAVKQRLPVWKKEYHVDGTAAWVDPSGKPVAHGP